MLPILNTAAGAVRGSHERIAGVAHNVANLQTAVDAPDRPVAPPDGSDGQLDLPPDQQGGGSGEPVPKADLARQIAIQIQAELESKANVRLIHSVDDTLGRVIDLLA